MKKLFVCVVPLVLALAACSSDAPRQGRWNPNGVPRDENWHSPAAALLKYDANHDGVLTRDELVAGLHAEYNTFDVGHSNCLSLDQARAINQMRVQQDGSQATPLVDHHFYTTVSMVRTMEDLLALPPMNNNDAFAPPIASVFAGAGDQAPFDADYSNRDNGLIYTANKPNAPGAKESGKMDFRHEDRADPQKLNVILWKDAKGDAPVPAMLLTPQARFVDLDGPLLLARDRDNGLRYDGSLVYPPDADLWG